MNSISMLTVIAGLCATGSSLLVLRRGPTRRLRLMVLTSGLVSLSQTATLLHIMGIWGSGETYAVHIHQLLVAMLSMMSIYLLATESRDRKVADMRLRLAEHELMNAAPTSGNTAAANGTAVNLTAANLAAANGIGASLQTSADCISLLHEVTNNEPGREVCLSCVQAAQEISEAWNKITNALANHSPEAETGAELARAKLELAAALRKRWLHESESLHDLLDPRDEFVR